MIEVKERPKTRSESTAFSIRRIGVIGAGQMGSGIAHVTALAGFEVKLNDLSADRVKAGIATINGNMARQVSRKRITEEERQAALKRISPAELIRCFRRLRPRDRGSDRERGGQAHDLRQCLPGAQTGRHPRQQYVVDLDHPARLFHRPADALHRHSFHESGSADGARRAHPRNCYRRCDVRDDEAVRGQARQDHCRRRGFSRVHRQPHSAADDQ